MIRKPVATPSWINRRTVTLVCLALVVVVGIYLNSIVSGESPLDGGAQPAAAPGVKTPATVTPVVKSTSSPAELPRLTGSAIEDLRNERERVRAQELTILDGMIADSKTSAEGKRDAEAQKLKLTQFIDQEATTEGLLRAKGYERVAVTVRDGTVNVVVGANSLTEKDVTRILDITAKETKQPATNITVMTSK